MCSSSGCVPQHGCLACYTMQLHGTTQTAQCYMRAHSLGKLSVITGPSALRKGASMQLFGRLRLLPAWYMLPSTLSSLCSCPCDAAMTSAHVACMPNETCSQVPEHVQLPWLMRAPLQQVSAGDQRATLASSPGAASQQPTLRPIPAASAHVSLAHRCRGAPMRRASRTWLCTPMLPHPFPGAHAHSPSLHTQTCTAGAGRRVRRVEHTAGTRANPTWGANPVRGSDTSAIRTLGGCQSGW